MQIDVSKPEGNAFTVMGTVRRFLIDTARGDEVKRVLARMQAGDYKHLCEVATQVSNGSITFYHPTEDEFHG